MSRFCRVGIATFILTCAPFAAFALEDVACSITATPSRAAPGEKVTLTWDSYNARSATLDGFGPVPLQGSRTITASQTKDFTVSVSGYNTIHTLVA